MVKSGNEVVYNDGVKIFIYLVQNKHLCTFQWLTAIFFNTKWWKNNPLVYSSCWLLHSNKGARWFLQKIVKLVTQFVLPLVSVYGVWQIFWRNHLITVNKSRTQEDCYFNIIELGDLSVIEMYTKCSFWTWYDEILLTPINFLYNNNPDE